MTLKYHREVALVPLELVLSNAEKVKEKDCQIGLELHFQLVYRREYLMKQS